MSKQTLNVLFKKMQRDDKKDVLKFEYRGKDEDEKFNIPSDIYLLVGEMVNIEVEGTGCGPISAELQKANKDSKKVVLDLSLRGDNAEKAVDLYKQAGKDVKLTIEPSQSSLLDEENEPEDDHEGLEYAVDLGGNVNVKKSVDEEEVPEPSEDDLSEDDLPFD